ncbi:MAG: ECF transporter S component, partial [Finegoldia magna]|nr:ECF transporter S component [Finegoldia magna]
LIGTPIAVFVYGGITGDFNDVFFTALKNSGQTIFSAAFLPRVASNLVDKIITCSIVSLLYKRVKSML